MSNSPKKGGNGGGDPLHPVKVSKDSKFMKQAPMKGTHLVVTVIDGKGLLASDAWSGKSDPICFLWCGPYPENMEGNDGSDAHMDATTFDECGPLGILRTKTCTQTLDPVWNEELIFPLAIEEINSLTKLRVIIMCRDEDWNDDPDNPEGEQLQQFDDLGICEISIRDVVVFGKAMPAAKTIVDANHQFELKRGRKMDINAKGSLRITTKIIFDEQECEKLYSQVGGAVKNLSDFIQTFQWNVADIWEKENVPKGGGAGGGGFGGSNRSASPLARLKRPLSAGPPPGTYLLIHTHTPLTSNPLPAQTQSYRLILPLPFHSPSYPFHLPSCPLTPSYPLTPLSHPFQMSFHIPFTYPLTHLSHPLNSPLSSFFHFYPLTIQGLRPEEMGQPEARLAVVLDPPHPGRSFLSTNQPLPAPPRPLL